MSPFPAARYPRAERLLPGHAPRLIVGGDVEPHFVGDSDRFWFREQTERGHRFVLVDPDRARSGPAFDHEALAQALRTLTGRPCHRAQLPFEAIELDGQAVWFETDGRSYRFDPASGECRPVTHTRSSPHWSISPDGRWAVRIDEPNLVLIDRRTGEERAATTDGTADRRYGLRLDWGVLTRRLRDAPMPPLVVWSPDSRRFVAERVDLSAVEWTHLVAAPPDGERVRPRLYSFRDALPGDAGIALIELAVVSVDGGPLVNVQLEPIPAGTMTLIERSQVWWSRDARRLQLVVPDRVSRRARLVAVDPLDGHAQTIVDERSQTPVHPNPIVYNRPNARVLGDGRQAIWFSQSDGWGHLWLVDGDDWRRLTSGEWVVHDLLDVDEGRGDMLFTAGGREPDRDPYLRHLYRLDLAGGEPQLLTPEDADHAVTVAPSGAWFVDSWSRPDVPTTTVVRARDGSLVAEVATTDISALVATGWQPPQSFTVTAADDETELHGVLYLPTDFDEGQRLPVLDIIYPGPQVTFVPKRFGLNMDQCEAFAELGLAVMMLDHRGTPLRSRAFHEVAYDVLETTVGLADHVAAIDQLAERHTWIDPDRVGILGHSGGGYIAARALLTHPEVFGTGVAVVGNHDNRRYHAGWGERYLGLPRDNPEAWARQSNLPLAANLRGKLLIALSDMDPNVHPSSTVSFIDALVKANRDHDVLYLPNGDHWVLDSPYFVRSVWDYLVTHLIGADPPAGYAIDPRALDGPGL